MDTSLVLRSLQSLLNALRLEAALVLPQSCSRQDRAACEITLANLQNSCMEILRRAESAKAELLKAGYSAPEHWLSLRVGPCVTMTEAASLFGRGSRYSIQIHRTDPACLSRIAHEIRVAIIRLKNQPEPPPIKPNERPAAQGAEPDRESRPEITLHRDRTFSIRGGPRLSLAEKDAAVLEAFLERSAMTESELQKVSGWERPGEILRKIGEKYPQFAPAIRRPGRKGNGGYSVTIKDESGCDIRGESVGNLG